MTLATLAAVIAVGLAGPLLATPRHLRVPVVVGELSLGILLGRTGTHWLDPSDPVLSFLANAGFALVMLVAGSHIPVRDSRLRSALGRGSARAAVVAALAIPVGFGVAVAGDTGHGPLYAVLLASSSAALVMPIVDEFQLAGPGILATIVQVSVADAACIVALPLVEQPARAGRVALGGLAVIAAGFAVSAVFRVLRARGLVDRMHELSKARNFGLELRVNLVILFGLAGLAEATGVSVMLAGFVAGLSLASQGEPRRLARQLFALSDGFLGPVFFVWLGASLNLRDLAGRPRMLLLAVLLTAGTLVVHGAVAWRRSAAEVVLSSAQLGIPIAAVTIGTRSHQLTSGESGAILAAALATVALTAWAAARLGAAGRDRPGDDR